MNKRLLSIITIGIITLGLIATPLYANASNIGYWTYVNVDGKLTRQFVYKNNNPLSKEPSNVQNNNQKNEVSSYPKGYWAYQYVEGKLTRIFMNTSENNESTSKNSEEVHQTNKTDVGSTNQYDMELTKDEITLLGMINQEREKIGLTPVKIDLEVLKAARLKSMDMAENHYFSHESPTYGDARMMLKNMSIDFTGAAENIAINGSIARAHNSFMASSAHKQNILGNGWTHVGLGIEKQTNGNGIIITEIFIKK